MGKAKSMTPPPAGFRPVESMEGRYFVNRSGEVWSGPRGRVIQGSPPGRCPYRIMRTGPNGNRKAHYVHHMVLETFVGPRPHGMACRHLNGDPTDNTLANLAWGTYKENQEDSRRHGTLANGERKSNSKLKAAQVHEIRDACDHGETQRAIASRYGVCQQLVSGINSRKRWKHLS